MGLDGRGVALEGPSHLVDRECQKSVERGVLRQPAPALVAFDEQTRLESDQLLHAGPEGYSNSEIDSGRIVMLHPGALGAT